MTAPALVAELRRTDKVFVWELRDGVVSYGYHGDLRAPPPSLALPYKLDDPLLVECLEWYLNEARRGV